ncbi:MAG: hypothetical protein ABIT83_16195 [Massilia sp.]
MMSSLFLLVALVWPDLDGLASVNQDDIASADREEAVSQFHAERALIAA